MNTSRILGLLVGFLLTTQPVFADSSLCGIVWRTDNVYQLDDFHAAMVFDKATNQAGDAYSLSAITALAYGQASGSCSEQFEQLPKEQQTEEGYAAYFLAQNKILFSGSLKGKYLPASEFRRRAKSSGFTLGLPGGSNRAKPAAEQSAPEPKPSRTTTRVASNPKPKASVVPGCPSCTVAQAY